MGDPRSGQELELDLCNFLDRVRAATPARIFVGGVGGAYRTATLLELRRDHAAARDTVTETIDLGGDFGLDFVHHWGLFEVATKARTKQEFLLRPDLGRSLDEPGRSEVKRRCSAGIDVQIAIGDGLSSAAVTAQVPVLLPLLREEIVARGWRMGQLFFIRHCRVGVLNDLGELLDPVVAILLIGERPGLATAHSLSAYMAFRPRPGHDDSRRNLISNIHARGVPPQQAARRIALLAEQMMARQTSGVHVKEKWPGESLGTEKPSTTNQLGE